MKTLPSVLSLATLLLLFACNKDEQQPFVSGSISGTITTKDAPYTPTEGIEVQLFDIWGFPSDTHSIQLIDSAFTDAAGKYRFDNLPEGNYGIVPQLESGFRFEPVNVADTSMITINQEKKDYQIDLLMYGPVNDLGLFIVFTITNHLPQWPPYLDYAIHFDRLIWIFGFPTWGMEPSHIGINYWEDSGYKEHYYGYMAPGWAVWNTWHVVFGTSNGASIFETDLSWPLPFTPEVAYFNLDFVNHTCTWDRDGTWAEFFGTKGVEEHPSVIVRQATPEN